MKSMRWGWILLGGFVAELLVFAIVIPLSLAAGPASLLYTAPPVSFVGTFVFGTWVARKAPHRRVLHGVLVGVVATVIYIAISRGQPEPIAYLIAHALKLLGGAAGGWVAARRGTAKAVSEAVPG
jgi:putative membrane protein (TIGR04086 family)